MRVRRRKKGKQKYILILLIMVLGISIGYASFSDRLNIVGTANANGKFDIGFISSKIIDAEGVNVVASKTVISEDKKSLMIDIRDLEYPGAGATVSCVVKNLGTIPAKLKGTTITGNNDKDISVTFVDSNKLNQTLSVNEMWTLKFIIKWNIDSNLETKKAINFSIALDYEQDTTEYQPKL